MRNIKLTIEYDGKRYLGWQRLGDNDKTIQEKIDQVSAAEKELTETKGFFNRTKVEEELEQLTNERKALEDKRKEWERYTNNEEEITYEKERLQKKYQNLRLKKAIVEKEFRQIDAYFGSFEDFSAKLITFLNRYTGKELHELDERIYE